MYQIFLFTKGVSILLKIRKRQNVNQIVIDDVDMCFTNCVTQTTTTIFRENSTKILGCKDAGIVYKTHIYVHSNFLSCKMSLVFVFLSLLNFRGRCMFISFFLPSFLCFAISSFNKPTSKSYVEERLWGPQEDFEHS